MFSRGIKTFFGFLIFSCLVNLKFLENVFSDNSFFSNLRKMTFLPKLKKIFCKTLSHSLIFFFLPNTYTVPNSPYSKTNNKIFELLLFFKFQIYFYLYLQTGPRPIEKYVFEKYFKFFNLLSSNFLKNHLLCPHPHSCHPHQFCFF